MNDVRYVLRRRRNKDALEKKEQKLLKRKLPAPKNGWKETKERKKSLTRGHVKDIESTVGIQFYMG